MSILIKGINNSNISSKGFPVGNVTNASIYYLNSKVYIKFSDPNNTVENNITLSTWYSTIIVRKENSIPTNIKDGDIILENITKDKYKETDFIDTNIEINRTYYYRFYTMSTDKIYNNSSDMIYKVETKNIDSNIKNNTWDQISKVSELGLAPSIWNIGDEIDITLSGTYNETITLQIWDFNHFDKSDGSGKAGIVFGMKNLMKDTDYMSKTPGYGNEDGWGSSYMRKTVMNKIYQSMPDEIKPKIKQVNIESTKGGSTGEGADIGVPTDDYIFLPGICEACYSKSASQSNFQKQFPIFTDDSSRIKKLSNGSKAVERWWVRDATASYYTAYCCITTDGRSASMYGNPNGSFTASKAGVCFCFNV